MSRSPILTLLSSGTISGEGIQEYSEDEKNKSILFHVYIRNKNLAAY